jgi:hypothetical protein
MDENSVKRAIIDLGIAMTLKLCYTVSAETNEDRGVLLLNAVNSTQYLIVGKAPLIRWTHVPSFVSATMAT